MGHHGKSWGVRRGDKPLFPPLTWSFLRDACILGHWGPSQMAVWRGWSRHIWTFGRVTKCWWVCTPTYTHRRRHMYRHLCEKRKNKIPSPWVSVSPQSYKHQCLLWLRTKLLGSCPSLAQTWAEGEGLGVRGRGEGTGVFCKHKAFLTYDQIKLCHKKSNGVSWGWEARDSQST